MLTHTQPLDMTRPTTHTREVDNGAQQVSASHMPWPTDPTPSHASPHVHMW